MGGQLPVEIAPGLLLGDFQCACDLGRLQQLGVTHVLNLAAGETRHQSVPYSQVGIELMAVAAEDEEGYPMLSQHLEESRRFMAQAGTCLVHCVAGLNRSGLVVAAQLMLTQRLTVLEAVQHCRRQRGALMLCNRSFQKQLIEFAHSQGLLGPAPGSPGAVVSEEAPEELAAPPPPPMGGRRRYRTALDQLA